MLQPNDLQIVVLDCPYKTWAQESTQRMFSKMVELKLKGYQYYHGMNAMPIDTSDFIATHFIVCEKRNNELFPIMAFRSISLSRCEEYGLPFSALNLVRNAKNPEVHLQYFQELIESHKSKANSLSYLSSWTIDPEVRVKNQSLVHRLTFFFLGMIYFAHERKQDGLLSAAGILRFRVPNILSSLGFQTARHGQTELSPIGAAFMRDEPVSFMELREFSPYTSLLEIKVRSYWNNRIVLEAKKESDFNEAA